MEVAAIIATETVSGPGRQLAGVAGPLRAAGVHLHVLVLCRDPSRTPPYASYLANAGVPHSVIADRGPADWRILRDVNAHLRHRPAQIVQTHGYKATAVGNMLRRTTPRRPWIAFYHGATDKGFRDRFYQAVEKRLLHGADRVVIVAATQRSVVGNSPHVRVVANAVVPELAGAGRDLPPPDSVARSAHPRVGVIGRLSREKGVDVFLHACAELSRQGVSFSAHIIGDGPDEMSLRRLSVVLGLEHRVTFVGRIDATSSLYAALDLVVLPSRSEGLPNVLLEALAADRPVVATAVGGIPEVLATKSAGVVVRPDDVGALATAIVDALRDGLQPAAAAARAVVVKRFSLESRAAEHVRIYRELVNGHVAMRVPS